MGYQSFKNEVGASNSESKYKCLKIDNKIVNGKSVLDIGCNEGFFSEKFIELGASKYLGIDASSKFIELAKKRFNNSNIKFELGNISTFETTEKFDIILIASALHYMNATVIIPKIKSMLNDGGLFIFEGGIIDNDKIDQWIEVKRSTDIVTHPTSLAFKNLVSKNFRIIKFIGNSVLQSGDPIPRFVYHCYL